MFVYGNWEYHPVYGNCSRLIYKQVGNHTLILVGREYKSFEI